MAKKRKTPKADPHQPDKLTPAQVHAIYNLQSALRVAGEHNGITIVATPQRLMACRYDALDRALAGGPEALERLFSKDNERRAWLALDNYDYRPIETPGTDPAQAYPEAGPQFKNIEELRQAAQAALAKAEESSAQLRRSIDAAGQAPADWQQPGLFG